MVHAHEHKDGVMATEQGQKKTERLHMLISPNEIAAIDDYRFAHRISTRAEAVRRLCQIGLLVGPHTQSVTDAVIEISEELQSLDEQVAGIWRALANPMLKGDTVDRESILSHMDGFLEGISNLGDRIEGVSTALIALHNGVVDVSESVSLKEGNKALDESIETLSALHDRLMKSRAEIRRNRQMIRSYGYQPKRDGEGEE